MFRIWEVILLIHFFEITNKIEDLSAFEEYIQKLLDKKYFSTIKNFLKSVIDKRKFVKKDNIDYNNVVENYTSILESSVKSIDIRKYRASLLSFAKGKASILAKSFLRSYETSMTFDEFYNLNKEVLHDFNISKMKAEFNHTKNSYNSAILFESYLKDDNIKYLTWKTREDNKVRLSHRELNNLTLPKNDAFWDKYVPGHAGYNCRCVWIGSENVKKKNLDDSIAASNDPTYISSIDKQIPNYFRFNPYKTGKIFDENHPYFIKDNFINFNKKITVK